MTLPAFWTRRGERERRLMAAGAAIVALLLLVAFVVVPLERARARLAREVPELRASVAALQKDADEARRLRLLPPAASGAATPLAALAPPQGARLAAVDERHLKLTGDDVGFGALLEWLATSAAPQGLRVERARLEALPTVGRVRADITLGRS